MPHKKGTATALLLAILSLSTVGCGLDRSDARAVSHSTFRAILAKDYQQLRQLVAPGGKTPDEQAWSDASFIRDATPGEGIKEQWVKGSITGYTLTESSLQDWQGLTYRPEKLAQVRFVLAGKSYVATFPIADIGGKWSPGSNPDSSDFFIRFKGPSSREDGRREPGGSPFDRQMVPFSLDKAIYGEPG